MEKLKNKSEIRLDREIPKVIHFVAPATLSSKQSDIIDLAREAHPEWRIRVWQDGSDLPVSPLNRYLSKCNSGAQRGDLIRLGAVFSEGGIYLDCDMRVLLPLDPLIRDTSFFVASEDGYNLTNAAFGATRHHPALTAMIEFLDENEPDWELPANVTTGPALFGKILRWRSDICMYPRETFYPYHHYDPVHKPHELSYCEHLWAMSWVPKESKLRFYGKKRLRELRSIPRNLVRSVVRSALNSVARVARQSVYKPLPWYSLSPRIVVSTVHGHQLVANGGDYSITPKLVRDGFFELGSERFVANTVEGGDWFIDVGANVGLFSLIAAGRCGPFGRVFAFESNPSMAELLAESAALNCFHDRILVRTTAISDEADKKLLNRTCDARLVDQVNEKEQYSGGAFAKTRGYLSAETILDVKSARLDDLFPVDVPIKLIKIDAGGHEGEVLAGAERLLRAKAFEHIMIEAIVDADLREWKNTYCWLSKLIDFGYEVSVANEDGELMRHASLGVALESMKENSLIFSARR